MRPLTAVLSYRAEPFFKGLLRSLTDSGQVEEAIIVCESPLDLRMDRCRTVVAGPLCSHGTIRLLLGEIRTKYLLFFTARRRFSITPELLSRFIETADATGAGMLYSDFQEEIEERKIVHRLIDYQAGSVRDDFDFGALMLFSIPAVREALSKQGEIRRVEFAGLYDLRLKVSIGRILHHIKEPLYTVKAPDDPAGGEKLFDYVDPRNRALQKEMETVFTSYLKRIGAYLSPDRLKRAEPENGSFPAEASVVVPVRNRRETIADAVGSALSQETDFPFNVIVVDNHSTDGTTAVLSDLASKHPALNRIIPERRDLGIGGCWNEAIHSKMCGRFVVQLDSDDLYSGPDTLQRMVDELRRGNYAMVIGAYTLVDSELREIPPGIIDHREWTDENGHNNALRINGLGAPRAFDTTLMRKIEFLNVSYGEDYAAGLRICREYRIGRIYESLYLCRRWKGNTDAGLSIEEANRNNEFKDWIRTEEIVARKEITNRSLQGAAGVDVVKKDH
jgi:hypothetical protein